MRWARGLILDFSFCLLSRRQLATREHMMPHIFDQAPLSRPRTPSVGGGAYAMSPLSGAIDDASTGTRSRTDASFGSSKPMPSISCTLSESAGTETAPEAIQGGPNANPAASASASASASPSSSSSPSSRDQGRPAFIPNGGGRGRGGPVLSAAELAARLPPHLAALRAGVPPRSQASSVPMPQPSLSPTPTPTTTNRTGSAPNALGISSPSLASPQDGDNSKIQQPSQPPPPPQPATADSAVADEPIDVDPPVNRNMIATRLSMSSMDVGNTAAAAGLSEGSSGRKSSISDSKRPSLDLDTMNLRRESISNTPASTPILVNPLCSGYFVEPVSGFPLSPFLALPFPFSFLFRFARCSTNKLGMLMHRPIPGFFLLCLHLFIDRMDGRFPVRGTARWEDHLSEREM